jgi:pimeloyl-ACP methyl ester carboxylesterase
VGAYAAFLSGHPVSAHWAEGAALAHARATLAEGDGGSHPCCPAEVEIAIYRSLAAADTWMRLHRFAGPVTIVGGDTTSERSSWAAWVQEDVAGHVAAATYRRISGCGHLMPFEQPGACRDVVLEAAGIDVGLPVGARLSKTGTRSGTQQETEPGRD